MPSIDTTFALIDVKHDRHKLKRRVDAGERVRVTVTGYLTRTWSRDDGTSIEFEMEVTGAEEGEPTCPTT